MKECREHTGSLYFRLVKTIIAAFMISIVMLTTFSTLLAQQEIKELLVRGNKRVDEFRIITISKLRIGDPASSLKTQLAIRKLYDSGLFRDVAVYWKPVINGVSIIIEVEEMPEISAIKLKGNKKIKEDKVKEKLSLRAGSYLNLSNLEESKNRILEMYKEKGYHLAEVEYNIKPEGDDRDKITLALNIKEGKKIRVEKISFSGNDHFSDGKLRGQMDTEEDGFFFWQGTDYNEEKLQEDLNDKLPTFYRKNGFVDIVVLDHTVTIEETIGKAFIDIVVKEGSRFHVGKIDVTGNEKFPKALLIAVLSLESGDIFNQERYEKSRTEVQELYGNEGYIYAQVQPKLEKDDESKLIDIEFQIAENNPAYVRRISINGNEVTHEKVIRRQLSIVPGDIFKQSLVMRSIQALQNTGYFESVVPEFPPTADNSGDVNMVLNVKEKRTGQVSAGAGFGAGGGLTGFVEFGQTNFRGRGQQLRLRVEFGRVRNNIELSFTEPAIFDSNISLGFDAFKSNYAQTFDVFNQNRVGGVLRLGFPFPHVPFTRVFLSYGLLRLDLEARSNDPEISRLINEEDFPQVQSSVTISMVRDTRDSIQHPSRGTRHSVSMEYAGGYLGGNTDFQKYRVSSAWSVPLFGPFNLTLLAKSGLIDGYSDPSTVPFSERFAVGGTNTEGLRGYEDGHVGPEPRFSSGIAQRGRFFLIGTAEVEYKITEQLYGTFFYDAGNNWKSLSEADFGNLLRGAGFGVKVETPVGPLGIAFGYGFDNPDGPQWVPHIQFGQFLR